MLEFRMCEVLLPRHGQLELIRLTYRSLLGGFGVEWLRGLNVIEVPRVLDEGHVDISRAEVVATHRSCRRRRG